MRLMNSISIPNVSPIFDAEWATNGLIDQAAQLLHDWAKAQDIKGATIELARLPGHTPLIFIEVQPTSTPSKTVLMYGHLDKQPPLTDDWAPGLHPYKPVVKDGKLYGRGGADDGYSICAALLSIKALQLQGLSHDRIVIMIEASEESGSPHLTDYVNHFSERIGTPSLVVCLDSGCGNYEQFWTTTSLRGLIAGDLEVHIVTQGQHSGSASGIVPSSFRIARILLDRVEDVQTGQIKLDALRINLPDHRVPEIRRCIDAMGANVFKEFPFVEGAGPVSDDLFKLTVNRTWEPTLSVIGAEGLPPLATVHEAARSPALLIYQAGNVLRPVTKLALSIRIPPGVDAQTAAAALKAELERDAPYGAKVAFKIKKCASGWEAPAFKPWLNKAMDEASNYFFKKPTNFIGEGGSIPFMGMLGRKFPEAQFVVTGLLGPASNAHGPDEMLVIDMGKKLTGCVAYILNEHCKQSNQ